MDGSISTCTKICGPFSVAHQKINKQIKQNTHTRQIACVCGGGGGRRVNSELPDAKFIPLNNSVPASWKKIPDSSVYIVRRLEMHDRRIVRFPSRRCGTGFNPLSYSVASARTSRRKAAGAYADHSLLHSAKVKISATTPCIRKVPTDRRTDFTSQKT
jgi:hypothetical protein